MNISLYLFIGFLFAPLLAWRPVKILQALLCLYWLVIVAWALEVIHPFNYASLLWSNWLQVSLSYQIDGLARLFTLLISGIGTLIFIYASIYEQGHPRKTAKLLALLQVFAISMLGVVLSDNTIVLFVAWELTSITSYLLIQFEVGEQESNKAAFNSLFISVAGSLALLAGLLILQQQVQSFSIQTTLHTQLSQGILSSTFWLLLIGAITKSALFPFYFWLVGAMKAPTPVSAYLHSATMVNAGIYLLARFHPLFGSLSVWYPTLAAFGLTTMLLAGILSLFQRDFKAILAYTTLFALGSMVYLLASHKWVAAQAFALFLLFHGLYKAAAFMWVGILDKTYETRDIEMLQGLGRKRLFASFIAIVVFCSMAGVPPFFGFVLKKMIYEVKLSSESVNYLTVAISLLSSMLIAAASLKCLYYWFKGSPQATLKKVYRFGLVPSFILVIFLLILELIMPLLSGLVSDAADSVIWSSMKFSDLKDNPLSMLFSLITISGGVILFFISQWINRHEIHWPALLNPLMLFEKGLAQFLRLGRWFTCYTQGLTLSKQLMCIVSTLIVWLGLAFYFSKAKWPTMYWYTGSLLFTLFSLLLVAISISLLLNSKFLINMVSLAVLGLLMSAIFVIAGAPDVAMTQSLVEILTVIILLIALRKARFKYVTLTKKQKIFHAVIALFIASAVTLLLFMITQNPLNTKIGDFFIENSLSQAQGRNVVNVILVDFRAFDTLGEVLVVFASTIAIYLLIDKTRSLKAVEGEQT